MGNPDHEWLRTTYRRIAYDFHIPGTREDFLSRLDAEHTADVLSSAGVQSLQLCAKSYWGYSLHPTTVGIQHPLLNGRDYFGEVLEALNAKGVKSLAYIIDFWDNHAGLSHPEWRYISLEERNGKKIDREDQKVITLCPSTGYEEYLCQQMEEVARNYPVGGIFNDMVGYLGFCHCPGCERRYKDDTGKSIPETEEWSDPDWREFIHWRYRTMEEILKVRKKRILAIDPDLVYGHNYFGSPFHHYGLSHDPVRAHASADFMTTETTPWDRGFGVHGSSLGAKLARDLSDGKPYEAVGARCATFHDFTEKSEQEMMIDGYSTVAHNCPHVIIESASMFGPPIDRGFELIGSVFKRIERLEPWLRGSRPVNHSAIYYSRASADMYSTIDKTRIMTELCGFYKNAVESHYPVKFLFDPTLRPENLEAVDLLILPDSAVLSEEQTELIKQYVSDGGGLLATHQASGVAEDGSSLKNFTLAEVFGCDKAGGPSDEVTWMAAANNSEEMGARDALGSSFILFQEKPSYVPVVLRPNATAVATRYSAPFPFPHGQKHSSHFEPPYHPTDEPLVVANQFGRGKCVYISPRAGTAYAENGYHHIRLLLQRAAAWASRQSPILTTDAPMSVETVLNVQNQRLVLHLLNFSIRAPFPISAMDFPGAGLGPIRKSWIAYDEIIPVRDIKVRIRSDARAVRAYSVPQRQEIEFSVDGKETVLEVDRLDDAATICVEYESEPV